ncbi:MOSC domain-containing protein [Streptomyces sp. NPDC005438]|uniref:MOSC domain-containing protein n=1 Tax=Streptomyces sp. NPDC005438 TaxID=3156880 RepID=UPI0033B2BAEE
MSTVSAVSGHPEYAFSKPTLDQVTLVEGWGVEGDVHGGVTVRHRSRMARDPHQPNLRQVHLIHRELFEELAEQGHRVAPGDLGENITTRGVDLLGLPEGTLLRLGEEAVVRVTGLRNPCRQIEDFQPGLLKRVLPRGPDGEVVRLAGVMSVVRRGGVVRPGDPVVVEPPRGAHHPLRPV